MVQQYDHELTETGLQQAISFHRRWKFALTTSHENENEIHDYQLFNQAKGIYSSPLTRAIQTALLTCEGHPAFQSSQRKLILLSSLREIKNFGSFDTVGRYSGDDIPRHVHEMLQRDLTDEIKCHEVLKPFIDSNDAQEQWWTALEIQETKADVNLRMKELWNYLRYVTAEEDKDNDKEDMEKKKEEGNDPTNNDFVIILVGHSHYFRQMMRQYLSPEYREKEPEWTTDLSQKKLDNAACLQITVVWKYPEDSLLIPSPVIENAKLVFDSQLVGEGEGGGAADEEEGYGN
jgi:broad specificity phosphatase PhoE